MNRQADYHWLFTADRELASACGCEVMCDCVRSGSCQRSHALFCVHINKTLWERDVGTSGSSFSYLSVFVLPGLHCPLCSKFMASDEIEKHLVKCFSKMRLTYNSKTSGEGDCWTWKTWHQSVATATIDICPYSVWLTKEDVKLNCDCAGG